MHRSPDVVRNEISEIVRKDNGAQILAAFKKTALNTAGVEKASAPRKRFWAGYSFDSLLRSPENPFILPLCLLQSFIHKPC
jgi:hypothetical protein